ncbi:ABC transporter ATP-binding protein [Cupriavidus basilensis]|uniref:ABC transporter ATP-binding protein n=1 Tax=Cupriavidus basilensis TaxID=68895 RepID=UPI002351E840|nr:ATP-binding cassette domain-containing protein [Cupriavidus basilensis]
MGASSIDTTAALARAVAGPPALETRDLTIRFGGHVAVNAVSCAFRPGELTCIVGPNGAGKTTYFNLISGQLPPSAGQILLGGEDVTRLPVPHKARRGIGRAFQLTSLFPNLSVFEWPRCRTATSASWRWASCWRCSHASSCSTSRPPAYEPTAGMSVDEVPVILGLIQEIKRDKSKTVLLVEHKMDVVRSLADRIIVLHNGNLMADGDPAEVIASPIVQQAYLGIAADGESAQQEGSHG